MDHHVTKRFRVLDCSIDAVEMGQGLDLVLQRISERTGGYVCFSNVHTVVTAINDRRLREITNHSFMSMPDGKPLSVVGRLKGVHNLGRGGGPDFMPLLLEKGAGLRHYFYGSTDEVLRALCAKVAAKYPDIEIAGAYSPPFRRLSQEEQAEILEQINATRPDVIWVGLGAPKQEYWMSEFFEQLKPAVLMGVGAAFDFHAGMLSRSPAWMRQAGLEWLYRLMQEPRRLWKRYLVTNSLFMFYLLLDVMKIRRA